MKINQGIASNSDERKLLFETVSSHLNLLVLRKLQYFGPENDVMKIHYY